MWINAEGQIYFGDMAAGDRAATAEEIAAYEALRSAPAVEAIARENDRAQDERRAAELAQSPDLLKQIEGLRLELKLLKGA